MPQGEDSEGVLIGSYDTTSGEITSEADTTNSMPSQSTESEVEDVSATETDSDDTESKPNAELIALNKKLEVSKRMIIDDIDEKFQQLASGKLTRDELDQWFDKIPERRDIANRSKRLKEVYRTFAEKPATQNITPAINANQPMDMNNINKLIDERLASQKNAEVEKAKEELCKSYAVRYGVKDDEYNKLVANAKAISQANPEWDYGTSLDRALNVIRPYKGSTLNFPNGITQDKVNIPEQQIDLSKQSFTVNVLDKK